MIEVDLSGLGKVRGELHNPNPLGFIHGRIENTGKGVVSEEKFKSLTMLTLKYLGG